MPPRESQNDRILAVLRDGEWWSTEQIHRRAGFSRLNSRIAELRKRGHVIEHRFVPEEARGPRAHEYRKVA